MITEKEFSKLKLARKYGLIKKEGEFIASRFFESYNVHLYSLNGIYVEVWFKVGLNLLYWVDVLKNEEILNEYLDNIDLKKDLGLNSDE
jgi:hypothetical protein